MFGVAAIINTFTQAISSSLKPILSDFEVLESNPNRVYFTSTGLIPTLTTAGFTISDKSILSVTVNTGAVSGHYFTVDSNFTFWDNNLIKLDGGDDTVFDFTLQKIYNRRDEPTYTDKYASPLGLGLHDGSSESNAWSYTEAGNNASPGDRVLCLNGVFDAEFKINVSGTETQPIKFEGYNNFAINVLLTRSPGMSFNSSAMPLVKNIDLEGTSYLNGRHHIVLENWQVTTNDTGIDNIDIEYANNIVIRNAYVEEGKNGFFAFHNRVQDRIRLQRIFTQNQGGTGTSFASTNAWLDDVYSCTSKVTNNDYYINLLGTTAGTPTNACITNSYVERFITDSHGGHGISLKADEDNHNGFIFTESLVENVTIKNVGQAFEFRHGATRANVARNINIEWDGNDNNSYVGIQFTSAEDNIIENSTFDVEYGVRFISSTEDLVSTSPGRNNTFKNCIWKNTTGLFKLWIFNSETSLAASQGKAHMAPEGNKFINCIVDQCTSALLYNVHSDGTAGSGNQVINTIVHDSAASLTSGTPMDFTYSYCDYWNSATLPGGTNFNIDPQFNASYEPQATFEDIDVPTNSEVLYGKNGYERSSDFTTVGSVLHADEQGGGPVDPPGIDYSLVNATYESEYDPSAQLGTALETLAVADGKVWLCTSGTCYEYALTSGDLPLVYANKSGSYNQTRNLFHWSADGDIAISANFGENVYGYNAHSIPFGVDGTSTYLGTLNNLSTQDTDGRGYCFNGDGTKFWMLGVTNNTIYEYDLAVPYTGAMTYSGNSLSLAGVSNAPAGLDISADGKYMIYGNRGSDSVDQWLLTTPGTLADGATFHFNLDVNAQTTTIYNLKYGEDGTRLFLVDSSEDKIVQINLNN